MGNSSSCASNGCVNCVGRNSGSEDLESYFPVRPECQDDVPKTRFKTRAGKTLSQRRWNDAFSLDGQLDIAAVLRRIQRGGIHPSIKGAVWQFLLGCFDPSSTFEERSELKQQRREKYAAWKAECKKIEPTIGSGRLMTAISENGQNLENITVPGVSQGNNDSFDKTLIQWKLSLSQIGLDVHRTDRSLVFYENEANLAKLWDILAIYAWVDKDISYVQGMSDICSPMVILFEDEADAFWCFEHAMRRLRENFKCTVNSVGVQSQLNTLSQIVKTIDPKLHRHLEELDGGDYLFAFRMLMVLFRRELSFVDSLYLWEVMWAMEYNPHIYSSYVESHHKNENVKVSNKELKQYGKFERKYAKTGWTDHRNALAIFLVAAVLETKQKRLIKEARGLDDVVNIMGEVTGNLDAKKALDGALKVHEKYLNKVKNQ
ncbi:PREDICTED: TBC1 domain family member 15 [Ipomoea nil]|uniref:TBC1 domain family member 15 n=1 Tax=Ipomoea nil TaxID=35883 RepID=UPI000901CF4B|nr:PREDICTED: TBC1 domain family member 15 [Ipomoea nil]